MSLINSILVCHDFSEPSQKALNYALKYAVAFGAQVHVYHALSDMEAYFGLQTVPFGTDLLKNTQDLMDKQVAQAKGGAQIPLQTEVETGPPKSLVIKKINDMKPDLVILGTHGRSGVKRFVMGSFAESLVRHSTRPLMLVRDNAPWPVKKILLPIEFGPDAETTVRMGSEVAKSLGASLHLFHALTLPDFFAIAGTLPENKQTDFMNEIRNKANEELTKLIKAHQTTQMTSAIGVGSIVEEIASEAKKTGCDLVIIPTHARHGMSHFLYGSTAEQILRYAPCPVMSFSL